MRQMDCEGYKLLSDEGRRDDPKVSVLTPIYNVERYLPQCLDSLKAQTLSDIEFICINDGSTDGSLEVLKDYAEGDARFVIIDKPNSGYGASMNVGLGEARGEYIGIVESDDWAEADMFETLYQLAAGNSVDVARGNRYDYTFESDAFNELLAGLPYGEVFRPVDLPGIFAPAPCIWSQVYRRAFLLENGIRFLETPGASFQDTGFVYKSYIAADRVVLTKDAHLHYRMDNLNSSVKSNAKIYCVVDEFHSIDEFLAARPDRRESFGGYYAALRYKTYKWNYDRLGWQGRRQFMRVMADEFSSASVASILDESVFSVRDWERIQGIIADPEGQFARESPVVSVVVPAYNCERHLADTLDSLLRQSQRNIQVIVVDDGSVDKTGDIADEYARRHGRITVVHQKNMGLSGARNTGMDHALGRYLSFIDAEDTVPSKALEKMVRALEAESADMSIGIIEEFDPVRKHQFEKTVDLAGKKYIDRFDTDFLLSLSANNKLFKRQMVQDLNLRFGDAFAEDVPFSLTYILNCDRIVGCGDGCVVLRYRRNLLWDNASLTGGANPTYVHSLIDVHERMIAYAEKMLDEAMDAEQDKLAWHRLAVIKAEYLSALHKRLASYLIDLQYRLVWLYDDETVDLIRGKVAEHGSRVLPDEWDGTCRYHADLPLGDGLPTKRELATMPLITIVLTKELNSSDVRLVLNALYHAHFPRFELLVPEELADWQELSISFDNVRVISCTPNNATCKDAALQMVRSSLVMFIDQRVIPHANVLFQLWKRTQNSQADFGCAPILHIDRQQEKRADYRSQRVLFDRRHCQGFTHRDLLNELDCSLANKLIKVSALKAAQFAFSETGAEDCHNLYDSLSFQKFGNITFITDVPEFQFLAHTSKRLQAILQATFVANRLGDRDSRARQMKKLGRLGKHIESRHLRHVADSWANVVALTPIGSDEVVFFSNRGLSGSLQLIYEELDARKKKLVTDLLPHSAEYDHYARTALSRARVIVMDDTCQYLRDMRLRSTQSVVQLWHACGAFKKFGVDNLRVDPWYERAAHRQYTAAIVSSDYVRQIYAGAFGIPEGKVLALGSPRTDLLLDEGANNLMRTNFYERHPELVGKHLYVYAPTFRQQNGVQAVWDPRIDWNQLSASLSENEVFVVKPHPLERFDLMGGRALPNVLRMENESTDILLRVASTLITDYSSIVFDAALLDVPTVFWCPDLDQYQTGFYLRFPDDLCGSLVEDVHDLLNEIRCASVEEDNGRMSTFRKKHLEACDGHATERVVQYINALL